MRLIGLAGVSGSGKSTVAGFFAAELLDRGFSVKLDGFGTPIKKRVMKLKQEKGLDAVLDKQADRVAMQNIGSAARAMSRGYYIASLAGRNSCYSGPPWTPADFLIVPDVRFPAEADFVKELGVLIYVCGCRKPLEGAAAAHESESHFAELFAGADYVIAEQPSLERLAAAVKALVDAGEHLKKQRS